MIVTRGVLRQAAAHPDLTAIEDDQGGLTYGELAWRALRAAAALERAGRPGTPVPVCLPRGRDFVVAALGAMLAGRPYVPIDPEGPPGHTRTLIEQTGAETVVTTSDHIAGGRAVRTPHALDQSAPAVPAERRGGAAYIVHTSGSTGEPKGVLVGHASLANLVSWHNRAYRLRPGVRHLHTAGLGFDAAVWEIWPCLCAGATLVVAPDEVRVTPGAIVEYARARRISILFAPTALAELIVELDADDDIPWRTLLTGGDALRMHRVPRGWTLINHYGPAEATVCATWHPVTRLPDSGLPPIGRPIDGARVVLLDDRRRLVPAGRTGEIHIGGRGLALGYHRRPEETERRFGPLPGLPGRWYRTGDLAAEDPHGDLVFHGRVDDGQLQVRGVRVEAAQVEAALLRHPRIRAAAVAPLGEPGTARLLGALVVPDGDCPTTAELHRFVAAELPAAAIPTHVVAGSAVPLTGNGKIDRRRVRHLVAAAAAGEGSG
ncbi:amino acid adenylation domain-containing protein [Spongiactinospora sp. 9N601]|uniref:amino acid adenylation domain-containing protein n=1 Tax=Spongiactinospora sp. 9N601 TaxID=3375149 RepID=UPI0037B8ACFF